MGHVTVIRRVPKRALAIGGIAVLAAAAVLAATGVAGGTSPHAPAAATGLPPATVTVKQGTLVQTQNVDGTLSYGVPVPLLAPPGASGLVTWMAAPGDVVTLGQPVYRVDGEPVVLIYGTVPFYRTLRQGDAGPDVKELKASLSRLGADELTGSDAYDAATARAVGTWQASLGLPQTGTVAPGQISVASGPIRVALQGLDVGSQLGTQANQTILTYSGATRVVTVALDVDLQQYVKTGDTAVVTLPDGAAVQGTVAMVGKVAATKQTAGQDTSGQDTGSQPATIDVTVSIAGQKALGSLDAAPVTLHLVTGTRHDVLIVPVTALLALPGGGYGVEVVHGKTASYAAVTTGMFASGMVEIAGPGIHAGTVVGVAK
jgi:peptidoglycan hydrolase-like protein with peptidoglycan-binding domain